jgi:hypothetical protein
MKHLLIILILCLSTSLMAEGKKGKGGDDFRAAAVEYETKAKASLDKGNAEESKIYFRLAAIKKNAAKLADEGKWGDINWDEYKELTKKLNTLKYGHHKKKHKK